MHGVHAAPAQTHSAGKQLGDAAHSPALQPVASTINAGSDPWPDLLPVPAILPGVPDTPVETGPPAQNQRTTNTHLPPESALGGHPAAGTLPTNSEGACPAAVEAQGVSLQHPPWEMIRAAASDLQAPLKAEPDTTLPAPPRVSPNAQAQLAPQPASATAQLDGGLSSTSPPAQVQARPTPQPVVQQAEQVPPAAPGQKFLLEPPESLPSAPPPLAAPPQPHEQSGGQQATSEQVAGPSTPEAQEEPCPEEGNPTWPAPNGILFLVDGLTP